MASMSRSTRPSLNATALEPWDDGETGRNVWIEGTVLRVAVSGVAGVLLGAVDSVEGWLRVECRSGGAQSGSTCDAMSRPE